MSNTHRIETGPRGTRILHRNSVKVLTEPVKVGASAHDENTVPVELIREGGVIRQIKVICPCGQAIVLDCQYPGERDGD